MRSQVQLFQGLLAKEVAKLCVDALRRSGQLQPIPMATPDKLFGITEQEEYLLTELVVPEPDHLGLWLHGMGER